MKRLLLGLSLGLLPATCLAADHPALCRMSFYALAATAQEAADISITTYGAFLDLVKNSEARNRWLAELEKNEDPFKVPEGDRALDSVRKPLGEFKRMLEELGWNTAELRSLLLETVRQRSEKAQQARETIVRVIKENPGVIQFPVQNGQFVRISPDGRYYVTLENVPSGGNTVVQVHDTVTKQSETVKLDGTGHHSAFTFNSDGTKLVMGDKNPLGPNGEETGFIRVYDFANGKLNPQGKRIDFLDNQGRELTKVLALQNPQWFATEVNPGRFGNSKNYFQMIDLTKGKSYALSDKWDYGAMHEVPGRNAIALIPRETDPEKQKLLVIGIGNEGTTTVHEIRIPKELAGVDVNAVQGDYVVLRDFQKRAMYLVGPDGKFTPLTVHQPQPDQFMAHALLHPNGKEYGVMSIDKAKNQFLTIWYDMKTHQKLGELYVPVGTYRLTPDGESLVVKGDHDVRIYPLSLGVPKAARPQ